MEEWKPTVVKGEYLIELLKSLSHETLVLVKKDLGEETFLNSRILKLVNESIDQRKRGSIENLDTISVEPPDFWED